MQLYGHKGDNDTVIYSYEAKEFFSKIEAMNSYSYDNGYLYWSIPFSYGELLTFEYIRYRDASGNLVFYSMVNNQVKGYTHTSTGEYIIT